MKNLQTARCPTIYIDGSFVSSKESPSDFDACWDMDGIDAAVLDPLLADFSNNRIAQKAKYGGELFPVYLPDVGVGRTFLEFFQLDKKTRAPKGIVAIDLRVERL